MSAEDKTSFAKEMDSIYTSELSSGNILSASEEYLDSLIEAHTFSTGDDRTQLENTLTQYGVYVYTKVSNVQPRSGSGDVTLTAPTLYYLAAENQWQMACGGYWNNDNWRSIDGIGNIGGKDAFGVGFTNTGTYKSSVVRVYARLSNADLTRNTSTTNRSDGDGSKGFGFQLQDEAFTLSFNSPTQYIGYKWFGSCTYDSNFASYSGIATGYYIHTYNSAAINSITFGVTGKIAGVNISIANVNDSFAAYSSDTIFGS